MWLFDGILTLVRSFSVTEDVNAKYNGRGNHKERKGIQGTFRLNPAQ